MLFMVIVIETMEVLLKLKCGEKEVEAEDLMTISDIFSVKLASGSVSKVRSLEQEDMCQYSGVTSGTWISKEEDPKNGLFRLHEYTPNPMGQEGHYVPSMYWKAQGQYSNCLGYISSSLGRTYVEWRGYGSLGLRPVISLSNVKLKLNGNVWKIVPNFDD